MSTDLQQWTMPPVYPGDIVYHSPDGRRQNFHPALILRVNKRHLDLWTVGGALHEAVRHIDDPKLNPIQIQDFGTWFESPTTERLIAAEREIAALQARVAELEAGLEPKKRSSIMGNQGKSDGPTGGNRGTVARSD